MREITYLTSILIICLLQIGCVSNKPSYKGDWERGDKIENPYYTVYLIGDAGNAPLGESTYVLDHLKKELDQESSESAIVWLGDNIYPVGLAPSSSPYYPEGRHRLVAQLNTMKAFKGQKFFVPGNHDWYAYGRVGLRRQEMLVDSFLATTPNPNNQNNFFVPDKGCGDPQIHELTDSIGVLLMDSQWFLSEKSRSDDQEVCDVKTPAEFMQKLDSEVTEHNDKSIIVASHHPPYTYAHHGGKFPLKDDIFPFTQAVDKFYLPLPVTGFIFNRMRVRLSDQDVYYPVYKKYRAKIIEALEKNGRNIVASGHEHTLQFIENHNQYFIVSGAGSKENKVAMGFGSKFAIGQMGYVKLTFISPKKALMQFIVPGEFEEFDNVAFEQNLELE
ncbi:metallophosphoesterase [Saprospiraceae bacterium]|nr:metallophosphoesterase [Saprospiraceae bacterium]